MPIYEYYSPDNHRIYQFYAKTLAQGGTIPPCPDNPAFRMVKVLSEFAVVGRAREAPASTEGGDDPVMDARLDAAMGAMEKEFSSVDENDPKAMARMMRRMAHLSGESIDPQMEEVVRKLEEGADPDSIEEAMGGEGGDDMADPAEDPPADSKGRPRPGRRAAPIRDPKLYDYP